MAIVPMKKVTLLGQKKDEDVILSSIQEAGLLHVKPLSHPAQIKKQWAFMLKQWTDYSRAHLILKQIEYKSQDSTGRIQDLSTIVKSICQIETRIQTCQNEIATLDKNIQFLRPFGSYRLCSEPPSPDTPISREYGKYQLRPRCRRT